jgi:hypothetical protein
MPSQLSNAALRSSRAKIVTLPASMASKTSEATFNVVDSVERC